MIVKKVQIQREIKTYVVEEYVIEAKNEDQYGTIVEDIFRENVLVEPNKIVDEWVEMGDSKLLKEEELTTKKGEQMNALNLTLKTVGTEEIVIEAELDGEKVNTVYQVLSKFVRESYKNAQLTYYNDTVFLEINSVDFDIPDTSSYVKDGYNEINGYQKTSLLNVLAECIEEIKETYERECVIKTETISLVNI